MDSDHILVAAGLTAAAVVGAFVLWGPQTGSGRHKSRLLGLVNLGQTCFLNTLLQALAACPTFTAWLEHDKRASETSLRATLAMVLSVINGTHSSVRGSNRESGVFAPDAVMSALRRLGWAIPPGEQDAHELFHVILSSLSEEASKYTNVQGSISDILAFDDLDSPSSNYDTNDGPWSLQSAGDAPNLASTSSLSLCEAANKCDTDDEDNVSVRSSFSLRPGSLRWHSGLRRRHRWLSQSCRGLGLGGPPTQLSEHPFTGTLATQLKCTECGYKAPVRYDKFESLSLTLPDEIGPGAWGRHKLHRLLTDFVAPEVVSDVACDACNKGREEEGSPLRSKHIKVVYFGKLPACLCIHVSRCTWTSGFGAGKRQDPVQFPERLSLAAYTYLQSQAASRRQTQLFTSSSEGGSPLSSSMPNAWGVFTNLTEGSREIRNLYILQAVVVHSGSAYSGHYSTYRRGPPPSHRKWFYASDVEIRESSLDEVLQSNAYMLFYEKSTRTDLYG